MIRKLNFIFCENEHGTGDVCFPDVKRLDGYDIQLAQHMRCRPNALRKNEEDPDWSVPA